MRKKVFVSGCFDMLHSGQVAFLERTAKFGDLHVAIGSDRTILGLKGRRPVTSEGERLFMMRALAVVKEAFISSGTGMLDFKPELRKIKPDLFVVNEDGHRQEKEDLCRELGIEYLVMRRASYENILRSTTALREVDQIPYRIDLAGGWLDQPFVSKQAPGAVVTVSVEPRIEFEERSGMAGSTRQRAVELWNNKLPVEDYEKTAKMLFAYDNSPGKGVISGSQDAIGIVYPGLAKAYYSGRYWPEKIEHNLDGEALDFVERHLYLKSLGPREEGYNPLRVKNINAESAGRLARAATDCWESIARRDLDGFGRAVREGFEVQAEMFPDVINDRVRKAIDEHRGEVKGWKLSGAGGGGYLVLVAEKPIKDALKITVRREL